MLAGSFSNGREKNETNLNCTLCGAGHFQDHSNKTLCQPCPIGMFMK